MNASVLFLLVATSVTALALVIPHDSGDWPKDWPAELEALRERSRTTEWATGSQEDSHRIPFETREDFEKHWPAILKLVKPGARLNLYSPKEKADLVQDHTGAAVIVQAPAASVQIDGKAVGKPWPKSAYLENGQLPEYVVQAEVDGEKTWVPLEKAGRVGFQFRARVDITLICDGKVIDLNRLHFPPEMVVRDHRQLLTTLHGAAAKGVLKQVRALLANGADPDGVDTVGDTALIVAARSGHAAIAEALLTAGADIQHKGRYEYDAVHEAIRADKPAVLELLLLENKPDAAEKERLLEIAKRFGREALAEKIRGGDE